MMLGKGGGERGILDFKRILFRTSMGEDITGWIECSDAENDDDTTDSEEEWHLIKDHEVKIEL